MKTKEGNVVREVCESAFDGTHRECCRLDVCELDVLPNSVEESPAVDVACDDGELLPSNSAIAATVLLQERSRSSQERSVTKSALQFELLLCGSLSLFW